MVLKGKCIVKKAFYLFATSVLLMVIMVACSNNKERIGVAFTFDDHSINQWHAHRSLFKKYNIHATFFISNPNLLDSNLINKLKILQSDGHEIACHGYQHKNAIDYEAKDYINQEIKPALRRLHEVGFEVTSFAYPFGASTQDLDSTLLNYFKTIRKATYNIQDTTIDKYPEIYANSSSYRIVNAMGIDYNYGISPENFKAGIKKALKNKEILIVYAHTIDTSNSDYTIHPDYLEKLFLICKNHQIKSVTMNEVSHYFQK